MTIPLEEVRHQVEGAVYKRGVEAARLYRLQDRVEFSYRREYLEARGPAIATTLPPGEDAVLSPAGALPPFFSGLLPEGRRLTALRQAVKTSADDELSLLLAVGSDVIGDVQVVPFGYAPEATEPAVTVASWDRVRFTQLFERSVGGRAIDRVAIPGVQGKVSARMMDIPVAQRGDRFILKLNPPEFPHLVENEAFFLSAAHLSGLPTAEARVVHDADGVSGLLVRRFDRIPSRQLQPAMRAQEDACQVLGRYPADKYNVTAEEVVGGLAAATGAPRVAARDLLRQFAFAYLSCNGDAHAKNFSIVSDDCVEWRVSPAYDLPSSYVYEDYTMALSIAGKHGEDITRASFVEFGNAIGVRQAATEAVLDDLCARLPRWLERVDALPFDSWRLVKLRRAIEYRRDRLTQG